MRKVHIDLLRLISIALVMFNHTGDKGYMLFTERTESPFYFVFMFCSVFCKIAVPIFFMISGALLLKKQESYKEVIKKRLLRIIVALLIASVVYYLLFNESDKNSILDFFKTIYSSSATTSLWYLYSYCGVLLMLPLLQKLAKAMSNLDFIYLICAFIVLTGVVPALEYVLSNGDISLNAHFSATLLTTSNIVYMLTGYFLENRIKEESFSKKYCVLLSIASFAAIVLTCVLTHMKISEAGLSSLEEVESCFNLFIIVPAFSMFFITKGFLLKINISNKINKLITILGASVFGAYLIEKLVRVITGRIYIFLAPYIGSFFATVVWVAIGTSTSLLIITAVKKCPYIGKLVNRLI